MRRIFGKVFDWKLLFLPACILIFFYFFSSARRWLDPDFGWHLRLGQLMLQMHDVFHVDPFSYTMPSYPFVDHEWLTNILYANLYSFIGLKAMMLFFAFLAFSAVFIQGFSARKQWVLLPLLLSAAGLFPFIGIRPQMISWLLFSVLLILLLHPDLWRRFRWFLPFYIVLWVNLHASFAFGVAVILTVLFFDCFQRKKIGISDLLLAGSCLLATFINPYSVRIWWEVWMQMTDSNLKWRIVEWWPAVTSFNFGFMLLMPISTVLIVRYWKQFRLMELFLFGVLLIMGITTDRHLPFWLLLAIPLTSRALTYFYQEAAEHPWSKIRFMTLYNFLSFSIFILILLQTLVANWTIQDLRLYTSRYPEKAVEFLKKHPAKGNIFAEYNWGGYLIWQMPEKKVFIDGRMPSWRYKPVDKKESANAYVEYEQFLTSSTPAKPMLEKYAIDTVMFSKERETISGMTRFLSNLLKIPVFDKEKFDRKLKAAGLKQVYSDETVVIYRY